MVEAIPEFEEVVPRFQNFLDSRAHPSQIVWVFREDLSWEQPGQHCVRFPPPDENQALARWVFERGRAHGLVEVVALCCTESIVFATVWYPFDPEDEVQGWDKGLKLSIREPLTRARLVGNVVWGLRQFSAGHRRYQELNRSVAGGRVTRLLQRTLLRVAAEPQLR